MPSKEDYVDNFIKIDDIYDKNINFLIGSGASHGLFPTLALQLTDELGLEQTVETLATRFEQENASVLKTLLFMHYFKECIEPAINLDLSTGLTPTQSAVLSNYEQFVTTILSILYRKKLHSRSCNVFTTNYDACFEKTAENLLKKGNHNFILNDGTQGFNKRYLHARNFNTYAYQTGIFGQHKVDIPQINLLHIHGSTSWKKVDTNIQVSYAKNTKSKVVIPDEFIDDLKKFSKIVTDESKTVSDLDSAGFKSRDGKDFWSEYNKLPIVNPTKWKFHETVFEEHYYQLLRLLSYELEKPNTVLITFGFSFADEHILNLVNRSLSNPSLQLYVCCFDEDEQNRMQVKFANFKNVSLITHDTYLTFKNFNEYKFRINVAGA